MSFLFGSNSKRKLDTCHKDLQKIMNLAISRSLIDFGISEGYRSVERQNELYKRGLSTIDGFNKTGKHNKYPSEAADIYIWHPDKNIREAIDYDNIHLAYVSGIITSCSIELFEKGEISHKIRWGGNWDSDGVILIDQVLQDLPHFELLKVK